METNILETNIVRRSVENAISGSSSVSIIFPRIQEVCSHLNASDLTDSSWEFDLLQQFDKSHRFTLYLLFSSINFSFWDTPTWSITYRGRSHAASYGVMAALVRSLEEGAPITDWGYLSNISPSDFGHIFRGNRTIPMFDERVVIFREIGASLIKHDIRNPQLLFPSNLQRVINAIVDIFPSFNDIGELNGNNVYFYKRAQLLSAKCMKLVMGTAFNHCADFFTVFADYRLPQALRGMGVIKYNSELATMIDNGELLKNGSREEIEIRCNTIWAGELIRRGLNSMSINVSSIQIDSWLWRYAKTFENTLPPAHKVNTTFY